MPKTYTDDERTYIKKRLQEEAAYCLSCFGIKRTTVDELVRRVQIPKGTFYLFYASKELLLFDVLIDVHEQMEQELYIAVGKLKGRATPERLTEVLYNFYQKTNECGLLQLITTGEIELLYRKLPANVLQKHVGQDNEMVANIMKTLYLTKNINQDYLAAAFRNLFFGMVYKREIGEENFDEALKITIKGLVLQMF